MLSKLSNVDPLLHTLGQALLSSCQIDSNNLENNMHRGVSFSWVADASCGDHQSGRVFIKGDRHNYLRNEIAAYHVARLSGIVDVAPCTVRVVDHLTTNCEKLVTRECMVMMFLTGYETVSEKIGASASDMFKRRCRLFDFLIDNGDRHTKNMMVRDTHEVAIDHAFGFSEDNHIPKKFKMHEDDLKFVRQLRASPILDFLRPLLPPKSLINFVARLSLLPKTRAELRTINTEYEKKWGYR